MTSFVSFKGPNAVSHQVGFSLDKGASVYGLRAAPAYGSAKGERGLLKPFSFSTSRCCEYHSKVPVSIYFTLLKGWWVMEDIFTGLGEIILCESAASLVRKPERKPLYLRLARGSGFSGGNAPRGPGSHYCIIVIT